MQIDEARVVNGLKNCWDELTSYSYCFLAPIGRKTGKLWETRIDYANEAGSNWGCKTSFEGLLHNELVLHLTRVALGFWDAVFSFV